MMLWGNLVPQMVATMVCRLPMLHRLRGIMIHIIMSFLGPLGYAPFKKRLFYMNGNCQRALM